MAHAGAAAAPPRSPPEQLASPSRLDKSAQSSGTRRGRAACPSSAWNASAGAAARIRESREARVTRSAAGRTRRMKAIEPSGVRVAEASLDFGQLLIRVERLDLGWITASSRCVWARSSATNALKRR
jgi:hypothetical protein